MGGKKRGVGRKKSSGRPLPTPPSPVTEKPADEVPYIPMELWTGILIRTPAEDLVRFKWVCKEWHELIGSRSFAESHLEHWSSRPVSRILFDVETLGPNCDIFYSSNVNHGGSITRPDRRKGHYRVRCHSLLTRRQRTELGCGAKQLSVLASCDGLILIWYAEPTHYQPLICNPVTGSYKKLPVFQPRRDGDQAAGYEWTMLRTGSGQYYLCGIEKRGSLTGRQRERECCFLELQIGTKEQPARRWKELMVPLSDEWYIGPTTTKDGKVHWLATKRPNWADRYYTIKVLSLDILKEKFRASVSVESRLCEVERQPECCFFPWKGAFFYRKAHREDKSRLSSLWVLEDFDTMTWTEYGNFRLSHYDFLYLPGQHPVIGDSELPLGSFDEIYVFDLTSKKFLRLEIGSMGWLGRTHVHHTDSLIGCN